MINRFFISHPLEEDSILLALFPRFRYYWMDRSLVRFSAEAFVLQPASWLFFYSPRGVEYFKKGGMDSNRIHSYHIGAFGIKTAEAFETLFKRKCDFTGSGEKISTCDDFLRQSQGESVLFIQARHSQQSIQELSKFPENFNDLIVYKNEIESGISLDTFDIAILTSPMNSRAFLSNKGKADKYIAWGPTTAQEMDHLNMPVFKMAPQPNELAISEILHPIVNSSDMYS